MEWLKREGRCKRVGGLVRSHGGARGGLGGVFRATGSGSLGFRVARPWALGVFCFVVSGFVLLGG